MKNLSNLLIKAGLIFIISIFLAGCARDLANNVYTSEDTINIVLEGEILSSRDVVVKESDRLSDNTFGAASGALAGGVVASHASNGSAAATVGGVLIGGVAGAVTQGALGTTKATEYLVKVDTSKLQDTYFDGSRLMRNSLSAAKATGVITVIQTKNSKKDVAIASGSKVLVIINDKRVRVVAR